MHSLQSECKWKCQIRNHQEEADPQGYDDYDHIVSLLTKNSPTSIQLSEVVNISYTANFKENSCSKTNSPSK